MILLLFNLPRFLTIIQLYLIIKENIYFIFNRALNTLKNSSSNQKSKNATIVCGNLFISSFSEQQTLDILDRG